MEQNEDILFGDAPSPCAANEGETGIKMTVMGDTDWDNGG